MPSTGEAMLIAAVGCIVVMKLTCLVVAPGQAPALRFLLSPLLAPASWTQVRRVTLPAVGHLLLHLAGAALLLAAAVAAARWGIACCAESLWLTGYCTIPAAWLIGEVIGTTLQLLYAAGGGLMPPHHRAPWRARTLSEFWSGRWNRWVGDWLAQVVYRPLRRRRALAVVATFLASGVLHELFMSLPLLYTTGHCILGQPTLYFAIQAAALGMDVRLADAPAALRRVLLWAAVAGPAPLILNETFLRAFAFVG